MSEQNKQTEPWTLEEIKKDAIEDDAFWESPEFNVAAWDIVRLYTQKKFLLEQIALMEKRYSEMGDLDYREPEWLARNK